MNRIKVMNYEMLSDEELMVLYQNGTEEAFDILYGRHSGKVFGFIRKKIRNEEQCGDIFQEVFVKIHNSKSLYNKTLPLLPWIFTVTRNVLIDSTRKNKSEKKRDQIDFDKISMPIPEEASLDTVLPYLSKLPETQRAAIEMRYIEEKTFEEIAEKLKTSDLNVRQLISRGIKKVRSVMGENND